MSQYHGKNKKTKRACVIKNLITYKLSYVPSFQTRESLLDPVEFTQHCHHRKEKIRRPGTTNFKQEQPEENKLTQEDQEYHWPAQNIQEEYNRTTWAYWRNTTTRAEGIQQDEGQGGTLRLKEFGTNSQRQANIKTIYDQYQGQTWLHKKYLAQDYQRLTKETQGKSKQRGGRIT